MYPHVHRVQSNWPMVQKHGSNIQQSKRKECDRCAQVADMVGPRSPSSCPCLGRLSSVINLSRDDPPCKSLSPFFRKSGQCQHHDYSYQVKAELSLRPSWRPETICAESAAPRGIECLPCRADVWMVVTDRVTTWLI